jgi:hypothetical protein
MANTNAAPIIRLTKLDFILSIAGFIAWGASLIGVVTNVWLGSAVLLIAFGLLTYEFWKWSRVRKWPVVLRVAVALTADAIVLFSGSKQVVYQYHQDLISSGAPSQSLNITSAITTAQTYLTALLSKVPWLWVVGSVALGAFGVFVVMKRRQRKCPEPRLHGIAKQDAIRIKDLVRVTGIHYRPEFGKGSPYIDFVFGFFNISLFDLVIDNSIKKGSILFGEDNEKFYYPPKVEGENIGCRSRSGNYFVVRQAVTAEEITRFQKAKNLLLAFHGLEIMFQGTEHFPEIGPTQLNTHHYLETEKRMWRASDEGETVFTFTDEQWAALASGSIQNLAKIANASASEEHQPRLVFLRTDDLLVYKNDYGKIVRWENKPRSVKFRNEHPMFKVIVALYRNRPSESLTPASVNNVSAELSYEMGERTFLVSRALWFPENKSTIDIGYNDARGFILAEQHKTEMICAREKQDAVPLALNEAIVVVRLFSEADGSSVDGGKFKIESILEPNLGMRVTRID